MIAMSISNVRWGPSNPSIPLKNKALINGPGIEISFESSSGDNQELVTCMIDNARQLTVLRGPRPHARNLRQTISFLKQASCPVIVISRHGGSVPIACVLQMFVHFVSQLERKHEERHGTFSLEDVFDGRGYSANGLKVGGTVLASVTRASVQIWEFSF